MAKKKTGYMGFNNLKASLAKEPGIASPAGLAAAIGRRKYGKKKFNAAAAKGNKMGGK